MSITHGKCGQEWTGTLAAHCGGCCRTFSSTSSFDRHQRGGRCHDPATRGLVPVAKPWGTCWSNPPAETAWFDRRAGAA